jgi:hypothetical protein
MWILDIFRLGEIKAELKELRTERDKVKKAAAAVQRIRTEFEQLKNERNELKAAMDDVQRMEAYGLKKAVDLLNARKKQLIQDIETAEAAVVDRRQTLNQELSDLTQQITLKRQEIVELDEEALLQSFGFYQPRYDLASSDLYKNKLDQIRLHQARMIKDGTAVRNITTWTVNNSQREGERLIKDYVKLILRSFNNECDASIINVKFSNVNSIEKKIQKAFEALNKLGERMTIAITQEYLGLKLQELYLVYEHQVKKQEEKEEQKRIREQMREEAKLLKEIEEAKLKLEKEEKHFNKALILINDQLQKTSSSTERMALEVEKAKIEQKLVSVSKDLLTVEKREQNTRAGYVYVISNVGSFGENVYKIGVTRRLDPQERIDELGDASVPFEFDVHALIFSDDAPSLENALHKTFEHRRLNMINRRREFFHVTLDEIENVVKTNFKKPVEFIRVADAAQYRQSLKLKNGNGAVLRPPQQDKVLWQ